jgi:hypothetical protein
MTDVFRKEYKPLDESQKECIASIKEKASLLYKELQAVSDLDKYCFDCGREIAIAKTKLEECVMWAIKGVTK